MSGPGYDETDAMKDVGMKAFKDKIPREANPYQKNPERHNWFIGWDQAQREANE